MGCLEFEVAVEDVRNRSCLGSLEKIHNDHPKMPSKWLDLSTKNGATTMGGFLMAMKLQQVSVVAKFAGLRVKKTPVL